MLHNGRRVLHKRPELVGLKARVALQVVQESILVGIIVWVRLLHPQKLLPHTFPPPAAAATSVLIPLPTSIDRASHGCAIHSQSKRAMIAFALAARRRVRIFWGESRRIGCRRAMLERRAGTEG